MKTTTLNLFFAILLLPIISIAQECQTYTDISNSTYKNDILYASDQAWVNCDTTFRPTEKTNKIEALKMALLAGGHTNIPSTDPRQCFVDIPTTGDNSWMNPFVCYGLDNDFLVNRDNFNPAIDIDFAKASKLILKAITNENYSEDGTEWHDDYLAKMALYGFRLSPSATINRDYFVYMLREIANDPNRQPEIIPTPTPPPVTPTLPPIIPPVDDNTTLEVVGETAIGGFEHWFEPYRCFDSIIPSLALNIVNDTRDNLGNHILDLEYDTSGGSQSCVDTEGDSHTLAFGTRWRAEGLTFSDLTLEADKRKYKYKKVRVTIPNGKETQIRLAVITTLGKVMVKTLFVDSEGNIGTSQTISYGLGGIDIKDPNILAQIKLFIAELKSIKLDVEGLSAFDSLKKSTRKKDDNDLRKAFDAIKKRFDQAKKTLQEIKKVLKDHEEKKALEKALREIERKLNDIKKLIDRMKHKSDNSAEAIASIHLAIDEVIGMMSDGDILVVTTPTTTAQVIEGLNEILVNGLLGITFIKHHVSISVEYEVLDNGLIMLVNDAMHVTLMDDGKVSIKSNTSEIQIDFGVSESYIREDGTVVIDIVLDGKTMKIYIDVNGAITAVLKKRKKSLTLFSKHKACKLKVDKEGLLSLKCSKVKGKGKRNLLIETDTNFRSRFYMQIVDEEGKEISRKGRHEKATDSNDNNRLEIIEEEGKFVIKHRLKLEHNHRAE